MAETPASNELNLDDWIDSTRRTERSVYLYGRLDLLAEIDVLEAKQRAEKEIPEEDRPMGKTEGQKLQRDIDALWIQLDASKMEFRVSFIDDEQQAAIDEQVRKDVKDEADQAARKARQEGMDKCKRLEIKAVNDINTICRTMASAAAEKVIERETNVRIMAEAVVSPKMTPDQVRKLYKAVGDAQISLIRDAYTRATNETPQVTVPKSLQLSQSDDGPTSS